MMAEKYSLMPKSRLDIPLYFTSALTSPALSQQVEIPDEKVLNGPMYDSDVYNLMRMSLRQGDYENGKSILIHGTENPFLPRHQRKPATLDLPVNDTKCM